MKTVPLSITKVIFPLQLVSRQQLVANVKSVFLRESSRGTDFNFRKHIYHISTLRYVRTCAQLSKSVGSEQAIFRVSLVSMDEACEWKGWGGIRSRCRESSLCLLRKVNRGHRQKDKDLLQSKTLYCCSEHWRGRAAQAHAFKSYANRQALALRLRNRETSMEPFYNIERRYCKFNDMRWYNNLRVQPSNLLEKQLIACADSSMQKQLIITLKG